MTASVPPASPRFYQRPRFWKGLGLGLSALFLVYVLTGFFLAPWIIKVQVERQIEALTGRTTSVDKVRMNPLLLTFTMEGFKVAGGAYPQEVATGRREDPELIGFDRLHVQASLRSVRYFAPVLKDVQLEGPTAHLARLSDGTLNVADILAHIAAQTSPEAETETAGELPRFWVDRLVIKGGAFELRDAQVKPLFIHRTDPIDLAVNNFGILRRRAGEGRMEASTESGSRFVWEGEVHFDPPSSSGRLMVEQIELESFHPYFTPYLSLSLGQSRFSMDLRYSIDLAPGGELLRIDDGELRVDAMELADRSGEEDAFLTLQQVRLEGFTAALTALDVSISRIHASEGSFRIERRGDGSIALLDLLQKPPAPEVKPEAIPGVETGALPPVSFRLGSFEVDQFEIDYQDDSFGQSFHYPLSVKQFSLKNITHELDSPVDLVFKGDFRGVGRIQTIGKVTALPMTAELSIDLDGLPLSPLRPIASDFIQTGRIEGSAGFNGKLLARLDPADSASALPDISLEGTAMLKELRIEEPDTELALVSWESVHLHSIEARTNPMALMIEEIHLQRPSLHVSRDTEGRVNWLELISTDASAIEESDTSPSTATNTPPGEQIEALQEMLRTIPVDVSIPRIHVENAALGFRDDSVDPSVEERMDPIHITLTNFTLKEPKQVELDLQVRLRGRADLEGSGHWTGNDWLKDFRLDLKLSQFELPPLSPYSSAFIARAIGKGSLSFDLQYAVQDSLLRGRQSILLESFDLGERTPREGALNLPVGLAVSLLRDRQGNIQLDVPLSGDLNDPRFSLGGVIASAFGNIIQRAATAPFSLLGSVFSSGQSAEEAPDLSYVTFIPGKAELTPASVQKLTILAQALYDRPTLFLFFQVEDYSPEDKKALLQLQLREQLKAGMPTDMDSEAEATYYQQALEATYQEWARNRNNEDATEDLNEDAQAHPQQEMPPVEIVTTVTHTIDASSIVHGGQATSSRRPAARSVSSQETLTTTERRPAPRSGTVARETSGKAEVVEEGVSPEEMEAELIRGLQLSEERIRALHRNRLDAVRAYLLEAQDLQAEQLKEGLGSFTDETANPPAGSVRFSLE